MKNTMDGIIKPDYEGQLFKVEATEPDDSVYEGKPAVSYFDAKGKLTLRTWASDDDIRTWELLQAIDRLNAKLENLPKLTLNTIAPQMMKWVIRSTVIGPIRFFSKNRGWVKFDDLDLARDFYTDDEKAVFALPSPTSEWVVADEIDPESLIEKGPDDEKREWAMKLKHSDVDLYWNYATNKWVYYIQVKHSDQSIVTKYGKQFLEVPHCGEWVKVVKTGEVTR